MLNSGVLLQNFDRSVRPQDDFYRYVNGQWLDVTTIPSDRSNYGAFTLLQDSAERNLQTLLQEASTQQDRVPGSDAQRVGDFYASFMDEAKIEANGLAPLAEQFARIAAIASKQDVVRYMGYAQRIGVAQPFTFFVSIDDRNSSQYLGQVFQTGLGMPDRDYYLSRDAKLSAVRDKYRVYVKDILAAAATPDAESDAERIFALELRLANAHWTRVQNRDAEKTYNRYDLQGLAALTPAIDWNAFLAGAQIPAGKVTAINITQPSYFTAVSQAVAEAPVEDWRAYFRYKLLNAYASDLPTSFVQLNFDFTQRTVSGIEAMKPRWKRGVDAVENAIGELAGKMYVERHFSPAAKRRLETLVDNLKVAYAHGIDELEWMTPETKQRAHAKLALFSTKIGYPSQWRDWSGTGGEARRSHRQ